MPTIQDLVKEECRKVGVTITDEALEHVIWEETGYPCFWPDPDKTPEENMRTQVREWAEKQTKKPKSKAKAKAKSRTKWPQPPPMEMRAEIKSDGTWGATTPIPEEEVTKVLETVALENEITALKERLAQQHTVVQELAMFTEGIMLSEYVNAHDTTAYNIGIGRVSVFVERSRQLTQGE